MLFWLWYTPLSGPLTAEEVDAFAAALVAQGGDSERIGKFRRFFAEDDGAQFVMVNVLDMAEAPPALPATGPDGAESWDRAALMRYRSRRDLMEIVLDPATRERHEYKIAALDKTVAFPVSSQLFLSDLRLVLGLALLAIVGVVDALWRGSTRPEEAVAQSSSQVTG